MNERGRLLNLVRYVFAQCPDGMEYVKLASLLYLADREAYLTHGATITRARWLRRRWGVDIEGLRRVVAYMRRRGELAWTS